MATMNDVAKLAGVSRGTVSNVINGQKVKPHLKEKVEAAIAQLGYVPNANARSLKANKTDNVVVIVPTVWNPFFGRLITEIESELRRYKYKMILCLSQNDSAREEEYVEMAKQNKADGIISATYSNIWPRLMNSGIPLVTLERYFSQEIPFLSTDNFLGGEMAAKKLQELGCKKILFVGRQTENNQIARIRKEGFETYCKRNHLDYDCLYVQTSSENFPKILKEKISALYADEVPYDGIFTSVDRYVDHILEALKQKRPDLKAGEDIQIIGFDGVSTGPNDPVRISSIAQPVALIARKAVETLMHLIEKEPIISGQLFEPFFIQGETTRKPLD